MRKKNVGYLAFKKSGGGSIAKKHPSGCKVTTVVMQSDNYCDAKLQPSECNSKFIQFQLSISSNHQRITQQQKAIPPKLHNYTV